MSFVNREVELNPWHQEKRRAKHSRWTTGVNRDSGQQVNVDTEKRPGRLWHEGAVDTNGEHILLTYGDDPPEGGLRVALVARAPKLTFRVQFLITATEGDERTSSILRELRQELDNQLIGEHPLMVWDEAKYRCAITGGPDSTIHWNYAPQGDSEDHLNDRWN
jgi:hypothetical protein